MNRTSNQDNQQVAHEHRVLDSLNKPTASESQRPCSVCIALCKYTQPGCAHTHDSCVAIWKVVGRPAKRGAGHLADAVSGPSSKEVDVVHPQALNDCQQQQMLAWICWRAANVQHSFHEGLVHVCFCVNDVPCKSSAPSLALVHCHSVLSYTKLPKSSKSRQRYKRQLPISFDNKQWSNLHNTTECATLSLLHVSADSLPTSQSNHLQFGLLLAN